MAILAEREVRRRPRTERATERPDTLTPKESANVRTALRFLRVRHGGGVKLAALLRVRPDLVDKACAAKGRPTAGLAIRVARGAGVGVEDVLGGAWPPAGVCPHCGRS